MSAAYILVLFLLLVLTGFAFFVAAVLHLVKYFKGEEVEEPLKIFGGGVVLSIIMLNGALALAGMWGEASDAKAREQAMSEKVLETEQDMQSMRQICIEKFK